MPYFWLPGLRWLNRLIRATFALAIVVILAAGFGFGLFVSRVAEGQVTKGELSTGAIWAIGVSVPTLIAVGVIGGLNVFGGINPSSMGYSHWGYVAESAANVQLANLLLGAVVILTNSDPGGTFWRWDFGAIAQIFLLANVYLALVGLVTFFYVNWQKGLNWLARSFWPPLQITMPSGRTIHLE